MKLMIFESYHQFYKDVLDEEGYERCRAKVYRFLLDAAGDGAVPPLLPTSQRLGDERVRALQAGVMGSGPSATPTGSGGFWNLIWRLPR